MLRVAITVHRRLAETQGEVVVRRNVLLVGEARGLPRGLALGLRKRGRRLLGEVHGVFGQELVVSISEGGGHPALTSALGLLRIALRVEAYRLLIFGRRHISLVEEACRHPSLGSAASRLRVLPGGVLEAHRAILAVHLWQIFLADDARGHALLRPAGSQRAVQGLGLVEAHGDRCVVFVLIVLKLQLGCILLVNEAGRDTPLDPERQQAGLEMLLEGHLAISSASAFAHHRRPG
mmetsp:Transcript_116387/g.213783  ORF Transcript_116387/g.213783 Transcript_116387/m.213783 type:complete len:235 (-) Transcript_116387:159-863(-)